MPARSMLPPAPVAPSALIVPYCVMMSASTATWPPVAPPARIVPPSEAVSAVIATSPPNRPFASVTLLFAVMTDVDARNTTVPSAPTIADVALTVPSLRIAPA